MAIPVGGLHYNITYPILATVVSAYLLFNGAATNHRIPMVEDYCLTWGDGHLWLPKSYPNPVISDRNYLGFSLLVEIPYLCPGGDGLL